MMFYPIRSGHHMLGQDRAVKKSEINVNWMRLEPFIIGESHEKIPLS